MVDNRSLGNTFLTYRRVTRISCLFSFTKRHVAIIIAVDRIRQLFVYGKGYETDDLAKKIYTHGTTTINEAADSGEMQIIFVQSTGLSDKYYKIVRQLFMHYFIKPDQTTQV